jgi:hypothetical protein
MRPLPGSNSGCATPRSLPGSPGLLVSHNLEREGCEAGLVACENQQGGSSLGRQRSSEPRPGPVYNDVSYASVNIIRGDRIFNT